MSLNSVSDSFQELCKAEKVYEYFILLKVPIKENLYIFSEYSQNYFKRTNQGLD